MPENKQVKPKPGGLFPNNKVAFIDSTLNANRDKEWVRRLYQKNTPKLTLPGEDRPSTHLMADDGNGYVFPTLIQQPSQKGLTNMGRYAEKYARRNNTGIQFKNKEQGDYFASHDNGNNSFGGYKKGTGVLSEFSKGTKSINMNKKYKIKKAVNGLQDVAVPEQGSYSNVLSSTSSLAAAGSQFGPVGAVIGGVAGLATGLIQKKKQDAANKIAKATNLDNKINRSYAGDEDTINQGMQRFKKGGRVSTKMIEIEGKKTPEIHTDKDFNIKNLGTIPHSKGGNKVEAEEGDIVFNTQNSLSKFNKIATHLQEGNKAALTKEKNKLPEDKGSKNQTGNRGVKRDTAMEAEIDNPSNPNYKIRTNLSNNSKRPVSPSYKSINYGDIGYKSMSYPDLTKSTSTTGKESFSDGYKLPNYKTGTPITSPKTSIKPASNSISGKSTRKPNPISQILNAPAQVGKFIPNQNIDEPDLTPLKNSRTLDQVAESTKNSKPVDPISSSSKTTSPTSSSTNSSFSDKANTGLQLAGVANNLFQGLKGEKPVQESYINPETIKYSDRSQSLRNQSSGAMSAQIVNARSLSGGNVGNLRANSTAARIDNLDRQGGIDEKEQVRADAIQAQNVGIRNQANEINAQRKDKYQDINMQNRAAKQSYIDQAASDIGQYGMAKREESYMRNRDKLASDAQMAGYNSITSRYQHKTKLDGTPYFEPDASTSITRFSNPSAPTTKRKKFGLFSEGTKSVSTKYKMK